MASSLAPPPPPTSTLSRLWRTSFAVVSGQEDAQRYALQRPWRSTEGVVAEECPSPPSSVCVGRLLTATLPHHRASIWPIACHWWASPAHPHWRIEQPHKLVSSICMTAADEGDLLLCQEELCMLWWRRWLRRPSSPSPVPPPSSRCRSQDALARGYSGGAEVQDVVC
jgi:hypothetical protein